MQTSGNNVPIATEATLQTIERRARLYRKLVQALIASVAVMIAIAIWRSLSTLLYAPAVGVLLVGLWTAADAAELSRWRRAVEQSGVSAAVLQTVLQARADVPQATVRDMLTSLSEPVASSYRILPSSLVVTLAMLTCGARALDLKSIKWAFAAAFALFIVLLRQLLERYRPDHP